MAGDILLSNNINLLTVLVLVDHHIIIADEDRFSR